MEDEYPPQFIQFQPPIKEDLNGGINNEDYIEDMTVIISRVKYAVNEDNSDNDASTCTVKTLTTG